MVIKPVLIYFGILPRKNDLNFEFSFQRFFWVILKLRCIHNVREFIFEQKEGFLKISLRNIDRTKESDGK